MRWGRGCAGALLSLAAGAAWSDDAARLERLLAAMTSYQAAFQQSVANRYGETLQTATGQVVLQRPNRMRWQVDEPYPQLVLADGVSLWVYDPDLEQATVAPLADAIAGSTAVFLTGTADALTAHFHVHHVAAPTEGESAFVLEPKDASAVFREATIAFTADGLLASLTIADHLQQTTRMVFTAAVRNPVLESTLFEFEVPPGIDVIGEVPADTRHGSGRNESGRNESGKPAAN